MFESKITLISSGVFALAQTRRIFLMWGRKNAQKQQAD